METYDANPGAVGAKHTQSQRFLNGSWKGLWPNSSDADPPLRNLVESIVYGEQSLSEIALDPNPNAEAKSLLMWLSGFRTVLVSVFSGTSLEERER